MPIPTQPTTAWPEEDRPLLPFLPMIYVAWADGELAPEGLASDWWLLRSEVDHAGHGYGQFHGALWSPDGRLTALSRQTFVVFG